MFKKKESYHRRFNSRSRSKIGRKEKGFLRITKIEVTITPKIDDPEVRKRADQCKKMFENYCTVTASVREGINVKVNLDY